MCIRDRLKRVAGRVGVEGGSLLVAHEEFRPFNPNLFCSASGASAGVLYVTVLRHPLHRLVSLTFPHHRARAGGGGGFNRRSAAMPTSIRDRILREHDVDVRLHAWLAARDP